MHSFMRNFSLVVGHFVPINDPFWQLYLLLKKKLDLCTAKTIQKSCGDLISTLVAELHQLYLSITGDTLKPNHHHMVHYQMCMENCGPLGLISSMRYEGKHRDF